MGWLPFSRVGFGGMLGVTAALTACAIFFAAPAVEIVDIDLTSLGVSSGVAEVQLEVTNQNSRELDIRGFLYELEVRDTGEGGGWTLLAEGFFDHTLSIPGKEAMEVVVPVPFEYGGIGAALKSFLLDGEVLYRLRGEVWVGGSESGLQVPFRREGVLAR